MDDSRPAGLDAARELDPESATWLRDLRAGGTTAERGTERLRALLLRVARAEAARRRSRLPAEILGDLDDLCAQAADDATLAVLRKLPEFQGRSRFTTWAYKFAVLEVSVRLRRRSWHGRRVDLGSDGWNTVAAPSADTSAGLEAKELERAVRRAVIETLTEHQRRVFLAVVVEEIPIDVLAERSGSTRGAVYKTVHDARRRLKEALRVQGFGSDEP